MRERKRQQLGFADLELWRQGVRLDPLLEQISRFLDRHGELLELVHADLVRGLKKTRRGRSGLTAEQVLRAFVLQRVKSWDYRELRERIADGLTLRQFTRFWGAAVPKHDALQRSFMQLTPPTMRKLNEAVVAAAVHMKLEDGRRLRADTTVVETDVRYPRDSGLLWDSVRVISRLVDWLGTLAPEACSVFPDRTRRARRRMQEIGRMRERAQRQRTLARKYRDLLHVTTEVLATAEAVARRAQAATYANAMDGLRVDACCQEIDSFIALARRVIDQTERRVFRGETVPAAEKLYSIFETHTDLIVRGKAHKPVEFGHKVFLAESRKGLITDYQILAGNPADKNQLEPSIERHRQRFGSVPELYAADRGFYDTASNTRVEKRGVKLVAIPQCGGHKTVERQAHEKSRRFKTAQAFRSGIEGRISVLFRGRGMKRCSWSGAERFELFVGAAVLANNLLRIAMLLEKRRKSATPLPHAA
ncbi:MAG TPA: ISNCY family transposase [Candidatus Dormibacteraeota bacterium]|nr:ISNCY family transposase [Candidatus Dormibacteraeota bacterium]